MLNFLDITFNFFRFILIVLMVALLSLANGCSSQRMQFKNSDANLHDICWQKINQFNDQQDVLNRDLDQQIYQYQEVVEELRNFSITRGIVKRAPSTPILYYFL